MATGGTISLSYVVNNSEFNSKMADMKKNLQLLQTECRNAAKEVNLYGANTQNLAKKQETINQAIKQTKKIMAQYNQQLEKNKTALSSNQSELTKLASKKKELTKQYKDAVKTYGEESQEAQKLKQSLDQVSSEYDKMKGKVTTNKNNIQNYTAQLERQRSTLLDLQTQLKQTNEEIERQGNKFLQASEKFATAGKALENAGGKISELGDQVQKAGAVIVTASTAMATLAANYESGLAKVNTLVGASKEEIQAYGDTVLEMSNNTGIAVGDATDALYDAISAGVSYGDSVQYINDVNKLAVGGFTDITNASNLMTQIFNIYGKTTADVTDISNKLFLVQKNGVTTVAQLATNMGEAMTMGASYNVSLENILSSYASLTKQGRTAATAQTQLKAMIQELGDTGSNVGKILQEKTGKSFTTLMKEGNNLYDVLKMVKDSCQGNEDAFNNLWSSTEAGLSAMSLLSNEGEFFNQTLEDMANSAGLTDEAFSTIADTTEYKMKKSMNELKNSFTKLGQSLLPFVDKASSGIEKLSKIIGNLSPEVVTAVAKFGLLAVALGTGLKIVGTFTTVLGKGATALSTFFKIIADTKSTGSFIKAIASSGTTMGNFVQSISSATGAIGSLGATGVIGVAIAGFAALGVAIYNNQKEIKESEQAYAELGGKIGEFNGRLRSSESVWTEIFGKEYSWKFSDEYKSALDNAETDVANWVETLKGYQQQIYDILNNTEINQQTKDEQVATIIKDTIGAGNMEDQVNALKEGMKAKGFNDKDIEQATSNLRGQLESVYNDINGLEMKGMDMLKKYTKTTIDDMGNTVTEIDWNGFNKEFQGMLEEQHDNIVTSQATNYDDLAEMAQMYVDQQEIIYQNSEKGTLEHSQKRIDEYKKTKLAEIEADRQSAKEHGLLTEDYQKKLKLREDAVNNLAEAQNVAMQRMALYDKDYATSNGLMISEVNENTKMVKDSLNGTYSLYFDNISAMKEYANEVGGSTKQIADEFGNMQTILVDASGNVIGMLNDSSNTFNFLGQSAQNACNSLINNMGLTSATAQEKFAAICQAIDNGTLKAEEFGMSSNDLKRVASEMLGVANDANTMADKLNKIPKNVTTSVTVSGLETAKQNVSNLTASLVALAGRTFTTTVKANAVQSAMETGGTVNESGIYNTQEAGLELIDTVSPTQTAYSLADVARGELTYIPANSKVTNAAMTSLKMESMIDKKLESAMNLYMNNMEKRLINALKGNSSNGDFIVNMSNPHFENKESEQQNISNIKRIIKSMK